MGTKEKYLILRGRPAAQYYAVGNIGSGSEVFTFTSKKERDNFVAFGKADYRGSITSKKAKTYRDPVNL